MKTIPLIYTGSEVPGVSLGIPFLRHGTVKEAFAAKDAFQKAGASGGHIRTKIVTLKDQLAVGQPVQPGAPGRKQMNYRHLKEGGRRT
jgi:hypothetical protein